MEWNGEEWAAAEDSIDQNSPITFTHHPIPTHNEPRSTHHALRISAPPTRAMFRSQIIVILSIINHGASIMDDTKPNHMPTIIVLIYLTAILISIAWVTGKIDRVSDQLAAPTDAYPTEPTGVLVGTGCEGPSAVAVAWEESELPMCAKIERHELR